MEPAELTRRGQVPRKTLTKHPYAAIEHRVIDNPAFAALGPTAPKLLLLMARQLTKDNNGHLQASFKWCKKYGIGSEHTLRKSIAQLIAHGFIYRTRSHGANRAWARYAVTWLPIKRREGLFLDGYLAEAWRHWKPPQQKSTPQKVLEQSGRKCSFAPENPAESAGTLPAESADYELMPCRGDVSVPQIEWRETGQRRKREPAKAWIPGYLLQLVENGLVGKQCFQIPQGRTLQ